MEYKIKVIDHIQLAAPIGGEEKARKFYKGILGFEEVEKPDSLKQNGGVWFKAGNVHIHIGIEETFMPARKAHPAIEVENIEAFRQDLLDNEIDVTVDARLPGANRFYIYDCFGNRIEFLEWL